MAQLQIIDDKKKNYRKKSVISLCNVDYRLKRSGPIYDKVFMASGRFYGQVVFIFFCIDAPFRFTTMSAGKEGGREEGGGTRVRGHEGTVGF